MLKKLGLNRQLQGLTVLLIISAVFLLNGCAAKSSRSSKSFYPEYYAARQLQNQDIVALRELTVHPDLFVADSATLLLGSYYLYYGDENYGRLLIDKSYDSKNLDEEMSLFGQLWKIESLVREGEKGAAINMANNIREMRRTPVYMRVMQIYCNQLGILVTNDDEINTCLSIAVKGKEKFKEATAVDSIADTIQEQQLPISTDNMTYEEYLQAIGIGGAVENIDAVSSEAEETVEEINIKPDAKINLAGGDIFDEVAAGMIYGMGKYNNNYQLEPVTDYAAEENKEDMLLMLNSYDLFIGGKKANLGVNWVQLSNVASQLRVVRNKPEAVIITSDQNEKYGRIIADTLKDKGKKAHVIKISSKYQIQLQNILLEKKEEPYVIIIMAGEKEIMDIIPIAKYWQFNSAIHDVLIITGYVPEYNMTSDQESYFKSVYVLTSAYLAGNKEYLRVSEDYKGFYGVPMSGKSALGYDIITYINKIVNKDENGKYLTNIDGLVNGYAVRTAVLLYTDGNKLIEKGTFKPKIEEAESLPK